MGIVPLTAFGFSQYWEWEHKAPLSHWFFYHRIMPQIHQSFLDSFKLLMEAHHLITEEVLLIINSWTFCDKLFWATQCLLVLFFWPTLSPQLSFTLFTEAGIKCLFLCLVPSNDHSLTPRFPSTSGALGIPTSKFGPASSLTFSHPEEITSLLISVGYLTAYLCYSIQSIDMHSFPQHCYRVGANLT